MVDNGLTLLGSSPSNARSEGGIATNRQDSRPNFRRVADDAGVEGNRSTQRRQRVLWRTEVDWNVRLGGNTDNGLKGLGVAGQSERLQGLSEVAARHKKIDSYACPPFLERPQQSAAHFANRHTGKTVAEGFRPTYSNSPRARKPRGKRSQCPTYRVPNQPRSLGNGLTGDSVARVGARERSLD